MHEHGNFEENKLSIFTQIEVSNVSFSLLSYFKYLFFNYGFGETNKSFFLVGCQVTYIPIFTTILQYSRNGETGEGEGGVLLSPWGEK